MAKKKKQPHDVCKLVRFTDEEFELIKRAAQHSPIAVFIRQLAVESANQINAARREESHVSLAKKNVERSKQLKELHVYE
jgi:hypothetical protein